MKSAIVIILLIGISAIAFPDVFAHNTDLFVSAENPQFKNHFAGPMVVEVMVNGTSNDDEMGEPEVSVNGKTLQMVKAEDENWYGYFASKFDSLIVDGRQDSKIGKGLDFGIGLTTSCSFKVLGLNQTEALGVFIPRTVVNLDSTPPGILANCDQNRDYSQTEDLNMNVIRNAKKISQDNMKGKWPFIQIFDFKPKENVVVQYNKEGRTQGVNLIFDALPDLKDTKLELDGNGYYPESHVHLNVTDFQLNIDPTSKDSWTWTMADIGGLFYLLFDEEGNSNGVGISGATDFLPMLPDLMFGENGKLSLDQNDDTFLSTVNFTNNGVQKFAPIEASLHPITFIEEGENSGIFHNFDGENNSNLVILPDAIPTGKHGFADMLEYNGELHAILILHSNATISWSKPEYSMNEMAVLSVEDKDMNKNSKKIDSFTVTVNSRANPNGIKLLLNETKENSGIFKGNIKFANSPSAENELLVFDGDSVRAVYSDVLVNGKVSSIENTTSVSKWNLEAPKKILLEKDGIIIDFPGDIDEYFSTIGRIEQKLKDSDFDPDRFNIENTEDYSEEGKLVFTKTISIEINNLTEYYDVFASDPFSFPIGLNKTIYDEIKIEQQIKEFCLRNPNQQICDKNTKALDEILNKKGIHKVSESLILGPKLNSTNIETGQSSLSFVEQLTNSTINKNENSPKTGNNPSQVIHVPEINLKDNLFPYAMAQSANETIGISQQNFTSFNEFSLEKDFHFLNGFTLGYGIEKTWSYEYETLGASVFFVEAHVEAGLGIGLRIPIDLTVKMLPDPTLGLSNNTQFDASYLINTRDLNSKEYTNLNLGPLQTFGGKEFNIYLGPAASVYLEIFEIPVDLSDKSLLPVAKPESSDFIPPLGDKTIPISDFSVDILCDLASVCIPRTIAELEFSVGLSPRISGDKITMSSIPFDKTLLTDELVFSSNGQEKNSTFPILSSGNTIKNIKYYSNLHFVPKITINLSSKLIPFPSIDETLEIGEMNFTDIIFESHHNTKANYTIPGDMSSMGKILCDGTKVKLDSLFLIDEDKMEIKIEFDKKHVYYDILAKQNGKIVLDSPGEYLEGGKAVHRTISLDSDAPLDVIITFQGFGLDESKTCSIGEKVEFSNVIPEFGTMTVMIFGIILASILTLTFRSKIITKF